MKRMKDNRFSLVEASLRLLPNFSAVGPPFGLKISCRTYLFENAARTHQTNSKKTCVRVTRIKKVLGIYDCDLTKLNANFTQWQAWEVKLWNLPPLPPRVRWEKCAGVFVFFLGDCKQLFALSAFLYLMCNLIFSLFTWGIRQISDCAMPRTIIKSGNSHSRVVMGKIFLTVKISDLRRTHVHDLLPAQITFEDAML